ncbi:hypothetical protein AA13595_3078 [Gluconacetobacter johannae DSM 13595]|uniref:Helix-turn-helix domain-containing protein n=2 Tax=Gluconacetobacter johannae TaxID=112140 RepID=A0A7W4J8J5_9PROT|nr:helix-turn-helix domain-containing protein [Gluconacetobacter johannae]GBQ91265.1 hypothetical protein AA13595_3078 [Gluconacetobacter johannae DSM 13595]
MKSSLRARFERLGPIRDIERVQSGSRGRFVLSLSRNDWPGLNAIAATMALAKRGMKVSAAKKLIDELIADSEKAGVSTCSASLQVPKVESPAALLADLREAGVKAVHVDQKADVNVAAIRKKLKLTREQFAVRYGLEEETIKGWEKGVRAPDTAAKSYLRVIASDPGGVRVAYQRNVAGELQASLPQASDIPRQSVRHATPGPKT